ncbi:MAG: helix-turn-helix transcriptional regulator [Sedimenticolaceae bacterium]
MFDDQPGDSLTIKNDCQSAIEALMPRGYPAIDQVAEQMGSSVRTLQRRLLEAGVTYTTLVEQMRHDLACRKLETTQLHVAEIARDLGFKDHSSFSRAFMRWTGMPPRAYRQSLDRTGGHSGSSPARNRSVARSRHGS